MTLRLLRSTETRRRLAAAPRLEVEIVSDEQGLLDLEPIWDALADEAGLDHPFLTHEWVRTWWECFGDGHDLNVLLVREAGRPVALVPLMRSIGRLYGLRVRRLESLGNVHTPRFDAVVAHRGPEVYRTIWDAMRGGDPWDVAVLEHVPRTSPTLAWLGRLARRDGYLIGSWRSRSPYIRLGGDWDTYEGRLSGKFRANLRRRARRLERCGDVRHEIVSTGREVGVALQDGLRLEASGWKGRAGTAILADPATRRFYSLLAQRAARRGWLRLNFLRAGGRRIAFDFSLVYGGKAYVLKPAYDPSYASSSPYSQLLLRTLRDHLEHGVRELDFLGRDDGWKYDWACDTRAHEWLYILADTPRLRAAAYAKFRVAPALRRFRCLRAARDLVRGAAHGWTRRRRGLRAVQARGREGHHAR